MSYVQTYTGYGTIKRGDDIRSRTFTFEISIDGGANSDLNLSSAEMHIRTSNGRLLTTVSLGVAANVITQPLIPGATTESFPIGTLKFDIETVRASDGIRRTYIEGDIVVVQDYTYD